MANELLTTFSLQYLKNGQAINFSFAGPAITVSGNYVVDEVQLFPGAAVTAVNIGSITTCGWIAIVNLDSTNYLTLRLLASGTAVGKIKAGEGFLMRLASAPYLQANTADIKARIIVIED